MSKVERMAPLILRAFGERHQCEKEVVGGRGLMRKVFCAECNRHALALAKKIARSSTTAATNDGSPGRERS